MAIIESVESGWREQIANDKIDEYKIGDVLPNDVTGQEPEDEAEWELVCLQTKDCPCDTCSDERN